MLWLLRSIARASERGRLFAIVYCSETSEPWQSRRARAGKCTGELTKRTFTKQGATICPRPLPAPPPLAE